MTYPNLTALQATDPDTSFPSSPTLRLRQPEYAARQVVNLSDHHVQATAALPEETICPKVLSEPKSSRFVSRPCRCLVAPPHVAQQGPFEAPSENMADTDLIK